MLSDALVQYVFVLRRIRKQFPGFVKRSAFFMTETRARMPLESLETKPRDKFSR